MIPDWKGDKQDAHRLLDSNDSNYSEAKLDVSQTITADGEIEIVTRCQLPQVMHLGRDRERPGETETVILKTNLQLCIAMLQ